MRRAEHDDTCRYVAGLPFCEVLPISQLAWTEQAAPAGWRSSPL